MKAVITLLSVLAIIQTAALGVLTYRELGRPVMAQSLCTDALERRRQAERVLGETVRLVNYDDRATRLTYAAHLEARNGASDTLKSAIDHIQVYCR